MRINYCVTEFTAETLNFNFVFKFIIVITLLHITGILAPLYASFINIARMINFFHNVIIKQIAFRLWARYYYSFGISI